ncbi:MAG: protein nirF [Magnetococcales bacterium]|nr:protein nirF [Magnetococcales bacterium]
MIIHSHSLSLPPFRLFPPPVIVVLLALFFLPACTPLRGTGDLGIVIERATGGIQIVETSDKSSLFQVAGLGDLSHASAVYSRDERFAYIFGRDGGLSKLDVLTGEVVKRVVQGGNAIGGAISQDGSLVAVSNYTPGGVRVFDAVTLELVADIPAIGADGERSKVVGLVDIPGQRFVFSLFDAGEIWIADLKNPQEPQIQKFLDVGSKPYDALVSGDGRHYIAGLFGEDGLVLLDLWQPEKGVQRILDGYGKGEKKLPVYKMPHLEGWAMAGDLAFLPAIGRHEVLVVRTGTWEEVARIPLQGQPVFAMARPDGRQVWVNFAYPKNDAIQVIDTTSLKVVKTLKPGKGIMHMEFTPRGEHVWVSVRDLDRVEVYHTDRMERIATLPAEKPSGIFFSSRAHRTGL